MFPVQDINPTRRLPLVTYGLILVNVLVFLWEITMSEAQLQQVFIDLAVVPANLARDGFFAPESILDILRSMFMHGGWDHIFGNMLYLFLFGDNIEDRFGPILYLVLYFVSGFAATVAQYLIDPISTIPNIGASGAIAGVLGSYLILFPGIKVRGIVGLGRIGTMQEWPAWMVLGLWFVLQLFSGFASLGTQAQYGGGVAFFAHIGGFIAGVVITFILMTIIPQPPAEQRRQIAYQRHS
ncbi:MAG: rhomboid family intramembrane serine protease [Anaerolineae bacterium]|nr:rhomboid family intramembrane serine protease [Anaerolineae bacterium]